MILKYFFCFLFTVSPIVAFSEATGPIEINSIGCHLDNSTCYVYVSDSYGPAECNSSSIRWSKDNTTSGKETLSLLMTAFAAGKMVNFNITDTCYNAYPTFNYINVYK